jgi:excinuclease ABC subunit C
MQELKDKIKQLPHDPGVYKFLNDKDVVLYVGKAKDLKKTCSAIFRSR